MVREEILSKSKELVGQIYEKMNVIETCDSVAEKVKNLDVCFNDAENKQIVSLDVILNPKQLTEIREGIISKIYDNATEAQSFLERLNRKPATINPVFEAAVQGMVESSNPPKAGGRKVVELDIEQIKELYINQGMSYKGIAAKFNCSDFTVRKFCNKNGIVREAVKEDKPVQFVANTEMTVEAVKRIYTEGTMSLAEAAKYFGVGSGELYNFIEKHGLKKVVAKEKDPFRDAHKMSKDEFNSRRERP